MILSWWLSKNGRHRVVVAALGFARSRNWQLYRRCRLDVAASTAGCETVGIKPALWYVAGKSPATSACFESLDKCWGGSVCMRWNPLCPYILCPRLDSCLDFNRTRKRKYVISNCSCHEWDKSQLYQAPQSSISYLYENGGEYLVNKPDIGINLIQKWQISTC